MTQDGGDAGDQLEPRVVRDGGDHQSDRENREQPLQKIAGEGDRGRATAERAQDIGSARTTAAVGGQIDVAVDAGDDDACRNRSEQVSDKGGQGDLLRGNQGDSRGASSAYIISGVCPRTLPS